jgi:hypothetical protein
LVEVAFAVRGEGEWDAGDAGVVVFLEGDLCEFGFGEVDDGLSGFEGDVEDTDVGAEELVDGLGGVEGEWTAEHV